MKISWRALFQSFAIKIKINNKLKLGRFCDKEKLNNCILSFRQIKFKTNWEILEHILLDVNFKYRPILILQLNILNTIHNSSIVPRSMKSSLKINIASRFLSLSFLKHPLFVLFLFLVLVINISIFSLLMVLTYGFG